MIVGLEGILERKGSSSITVKAGPVSLNLFIPGSTLNKLGRIGEKLYLNTFLYLREDVISLYGFVSIDELWIFQKLISVSGIGPKMALSLLSSLSTEQLVSAITSGNVDALTQAPGIGKKIAGRIVLDLKAKLEKDWGGEIVPALIQEEADVVTALTTLGYSLKEATQAVSVLTDTKGYSIEEKVRLALQQLSKK
jgi:Holliday junction DNA helicase RuvA